MLSYSFYKHEGVSTTSENMVIEEPEKEIPSEMKVKQYIFRYKFILDNGISSFLLFSTYYLE